MRGASFERQHQLLRILEERREISVPEVADELGTNVRTVYRDLSVLERTGTPLRQIRQGKRARWRVMEGWKNRVSLTLSFQDLIALAAGCRALEGHPELHESAAQALRHVRDKLPQELKERADRAQESVVGPRLATGQGATERLSRLTRALETGETVQLQYAKARARKPRGYTVDPYRLVVQPQGTYLVGWCHEREGLRTFHLDRFRSIAGTGTCFERKAGADPDAVIHGVLGPWQGRAVEVRLRFSREATPFLSLDRVHPSLRVQSVSGGGTDATLRAPLSPALVRWLLSWGSDVRVMAPERLREKVREEHRKASEA
jgi:predicted DNA-binding transcriptional regulator YafY